MNVYQRTSAPPNRRSSEGNAMRAAAATGVNTAVAEGVTYYQRTFHGRPDQVSQVRQDLARHLAGSPITADAILIASELATNAIVHSASKGEFFTIRCERHPGYVWIETEDLGGPWRHRQLSDRPHGLDIISALAGPDNWGTETTGDGDRVVWARLDLLAAMEGPCEPPDAGPPPTRKTGPK